MTRSEIMVLQQRMRSVEQERAEFDSTTKDLEKENNQTKRTLEEQRIQATTMKRKLNEEKERLRLNILLKITRTMAAARPPCLLDRLPLCVLFCILLL